MHNLFELLDQAMNSPAALWVKQRYGDRREYWNQVDRELARLKRAYVEQQYQARKHAAQQRT